MQKVVLRVTQETLHAALEEDSSMLQHQVVIPAMFLVSSAMLMVRPHVWHVHLADTSVLELVLLVLQIVTRLLVMQLGVLHVTLEILHVVQTGDSSIVFIVKTAILLVQHVMDRGTTTV